MAIDNCYSRSPFAAATNSALGSCYPVCGGRPSVSPSGATGPTGPAGPAAATLPFSLGNSGELMTTDAQGNPEAVFFAGFGTSDAPPKLLQPGDWEAGVITFTDSDFSLGTSFIVPHDAVLKNIFVLFSAANYLSFDSGSTIHPFVCLAVAQNSELRFKILKETLTCAEPYYGDVSYPKHTTHRGSKVGLNVSLPAGSHAAIVVGIKAKGAESAQEGAFAVSGGIYME